MSPTDKSVEKNIEKKIKKVIADQLGVDLKELSNAQSYIDDLGADSLDIVELILSLEEEFDLEVPDEDAEKLLTVQDTIDYVRSKISL